MSQDKDAASGMKDAVVLFDGVCNLCDAAVQFIIDRDRKGRIRFAALGSEAARTALEGAGGAADLPDSMVLIDRRGVHTQSEAALRIARRLGLPWSLLAVFLILPRALRDPIYGWVARNRYRWFGSQVACRIPTPELRGRFLDADERGEASVVAPTIQTEEPAAQPDPGDRGLRTIPGRFLLVYPVLFMLPFPLTLFGLLGDVPGYEGSGIARAVGWLTGLHSEATQPAVVWLGRTLTGEDPSFEFTGSGDGLASYLGVLLDLILALGVALLWWAWRRARPVSAVVRDGASVLLRYYVAWVMLSYGFSKLFPLQFAVMGPDRQLQPYGDSSPMGLLWTFMGASPGYQMFGGAAEVVGALLLLFRRTSLAGALVVAGVMLNVFAMNIFFDVPVKLYSFHYMAFAVLIALPDVPRMIGFFVGQVPVAPRDIRPFWFRSGAARRVMGLLKVVLIGGLLFTNIDSRIERMRTRGLWAPTHELHGLYRVDGFTLGDGERTTGEPVPDGTRWVRVGLRPPWSATVQRADGTATRLRMSLDEEDSTIALYDRSFTEPPGEPMRLEELEDGRLKLAGQFEGAQISVTLRRDDQETLFDSRGFRWISEVPYNR